ncbi:Na+/H+ antiporter NhaA [Desertivirga xinjiangensis]|uniref:Na+/H+ antiporter NhaA n=1 Tax=Desertivirga xinjiangensis TaxID=539206 RepID=UPI00210E9704|nr:Na+/H+ antiporter NhaA [Pedobacter xinjiangensis]
MKKIIRRTFNPLKALIEDTRTVGVLLILSTCISILLANSSSGVTYRHFWHFESHSLHELSLPANFFEWINSFLMSFFFLLAGMEIKRELVSGELSSFKKAILPVGAALGGMVIPALIFVLFNLNSAYQSGWGIPTATDIAFSLGIASLFGKRVPTGLKIFLMALAIIDDLGAIMIVALFYGGNVSWLFLSLSVVVYMMLLVASSRKVNFAPLQVILSLILWFTVFKAGIEASIAGVLIAFAMPVKTLPAIEKEIHKPVNFLVLPLFALANTAILLPSDILGSLGSTLSLGVILGLVAGKPIGIYLFSRILVLLKVASLPKNISWNQVFSMGTLAGIGFTMSIFTTNLAFTSEAAKDSAKIAILFGMICSVAIAWAMFALIEKKSSSAKKVSLDQSPAELTLRTA